jgi:hypothetical protein
LARLVIDPGAGSEWRPISWETLLAPFTRSPNPWVAETSAAWLDHLSTALPIVNARTRWNRLRPGDPIPLVMRARMSWVYSRLKPPAPLVADFMASGGNKAWVARIQMPAPAAGYVVAAEIEDPSGRSWPARFESNGPNPVTGPRVWVGLRQHGVDGSEGFNWDYLAALWPLMRSACNDWMATRPGLPAAHDRAAWHRIGAPLGLIKPGATALPVQYGGAAGTRAAADGRGLDLAAHLAKLLALRDPGLPWHTIRLPIGDLAGALGTAGGIIAKIAGDVILLAQTEIGELSDADPARGGSSAMAHKANPVAAVCARACPHRGPGLHPIRWRGCLRHRRTLRWAGPERRRVHGYPMGHRALRTAALPILSLSPASRCLMPPWSAAKVESRTSALAGHHGRLGRCRAAVRAGDTRQDNKRPTVSTETVGLSTGICVSGRARGIRSFARSSAGRSMAG